MSTAIAIVGSMGIDVNSNNIYRKKLAETGKLAKKEETVIIEKKQIQIYGKKSVKDKNKLIFASHLQILPYQPSF